MPIPTASVNISTTPRATTGNLWSTYRAILLNELYASLRRRIEIFISLPFATLDRMALKVRLDEIGGDPTVAYAQGR